MVLNDIDRYWWREFPELNEILKPFAIVKNDIYHQDERYDIGLKYQCPKCKNIHLSSYAFHKGATTYCWEVDDALHNREIVVPMNAEYICVDENDPSNTIEPEWSKKGYFEKNPKIDKISNKKILNLEDEYRILKKSKPTTDKSLENIYHKALNKIRRSWINNFDVQNFRNKRIRKISCYKEFLQYRKNIFLWEYGTNRLKYLIKFSKWKIYNDNIENKRKEKEKKKRLEELRNRNYWLNQSGFEFEENISEMFDKLGYKNELTKGTGDKGVDIFLNNDTIVQCKATQSKVSPSVVRDLIGTMTYHNYEKGIIISTGGFSVGCKAYIKNFDIELWDLEKIISVSTTITNK